MKRVCSWCRSDLPGEEDGVITHSICEACERSVDDEIASEDAHCPSFRTRSLPTYILFVFTFPLRGFARWD